MKQSKDELLVKLFLSAVDGKAACKLRSGDDLYMLSQVAIWRGAPGKDGMAIPEMSAEPLSSDIPMLRIPALTDVSRFNAETYLWPQEVALPDSCADEGVWLMPCGPSFPDCGLEPGVLVLRDSGDMMTAEASVNGSLQATEISPVLVSLPGTLREALAGNKVALSDFGAVMRRGRMSSVWAVLLSGETSVLYVTMMQAGNPSCTDGIVTPSGVVLEGTGWSDATRSYKKLIKKRKANMKGLVNPITAKKEPQDPQPQPQAQTEPVQEPVQEPSPAETPAPAAAAAEETPKAEPVAQVTEAVESFKGPGQQAAPAQDVQAQAEDKPAKRRRKDAKPSATDAILALAEELKAQVEPLTADQFDSALDELRALRDLQIAAARRMANVALELGRVSKAALEKVEAIQQLMK